MKKVIFVLTLVSFSAASNAQKPIPKAPPPPPTVVQPPLPPPPPVPEIKQDLGCIEHSVAPPPPPPAPKIKRKRKA